MLLAFRHFLQEHGMNSKHLEGIKGLIIDMDGVLWRDTQPIGDLPAIFGKIRDLDLRFILATNNSTKTVDEYHAKLKRFGVVLDDWQVITAAEATGIYLQELYPEGVNAYVVGEPSLKQTLEKYGVKCVGENSDHVQLVIASLDYSLTYDKLKHASLLIQSGCEFIGTNPDLTFPTPSGLIPGSGTVVRALEIASGTKAKIIGKPEPLLYQIALRQLSLESQETLAVGDRIETDILGAQAAGIHTALVLTGVSTREQAASLDPQPEIIARDFTDLIF
jgi:4-nitrophenyl phosphatase